MKDSIKQVLIDLNSPKWCSGHPVPAYLKEIKKTDHLLGLEIGNSLERGSFFSYLNQKFLKDSNFITSYASDTENQISLFRREALTIILSYCRSYTRLWLISDECPFEDIPSEFEKVLFHLRKEKESDAYGFLEWHLYFDPKYSPMRSIPTISVVDDAAQHEQILKEEFSKFFSKSHHTKELEAIDFYVGGSGYLNSCLRSETKSEPRYQWVSPALNNMILKSRSPDQIRVFRSTGESFYQQGEIYESRCFISTSVYQTIADGFQSDESFRTMFQYLIPKDHPALYVGVDNAPGGHKTEREVILPIGTKFQIIEKSQNIMGRCNQTLIKAKILPYEKFYQSVGEYDEN